jgi:putative flippase GtrA
MISVARLLELVRFGTVTVLGLIVDLTLAWTLAVVFHVPLPMAAAVGFGCGALLNYLLHGLWTFGIGRRAFSGRRLASYGIVLAAVLTVRIASVATLILIFGEASGSEFEILVAATGVSFAANFFLSKYVVFRVRPPLEHPNSGCPVPGAEWGAMPDHEQRQTLTRRRRG